MTFIMTVVTLMNATENKKPLIKNLISFIRAYYYVWFRFSVMWMVVFQHVFSILKLWNKVMKLPGTLPKNLDFKKSSWRNYAVTMKHASQLWCIDDVYVTHPWSSHEATFKQIEANHQIGINDRAGASLSLDIVNFKKET